MSNTNTSAEQKAEYIVKNIRTCNNCGVYHDRDFNASKNLANYSPTAKSAECQARGETSSLVAAMQSESVSTKREVNINSLTN